MTVTYTFENVQEAESVFQGLWFLEETKRHIMTSFLLVKQFSGIICLSNMFADVDDFVTAQILPEMLDTMEKGPKDTPCQQN